MPPARPPSPAAAPRALFYLYGFFPQPLGATYSAISLARRLRDQGVEVSFLVEDLGPEWRDGGRYEGFAVQSFSLQQPGKLRKLRGLAKFSLHVWKNRARFDLFHVHGGGHVNLFLSWWVRRLTGRPTILKLTLDGFDSPEAVRAGRWGRLGLAAMRRASGIVAMTKGQHDKCLKAGLRGRLALIPNGVDTGRFRPAQAQEKSGLRAKHGLPASAPVMLYVGSLEERKGTDLLFQAWIALKRKWPDLFLLCAGNFTGIANSRKKLGAFLHERGVDPACLDAPDLRLLNRVEDVEELFRLADVFVFPSWREGFGTVQIEAMASGLPCVVYDVPGISADIFPDGSCGIRVPENRAEAYVLAVNNLLSDPALRQRLGDAARRRAVEHFSDTGVAARYLAFYRELLDAPAP
jgi:glycosyltransferase involved in cell wall biosynthesis